MPRASLAVRLLSCCLAGSTLTLLAACSAGAGPYGYDDDVQPFYEDSIQHAPDEIPTKQEIDRLTQESWDQFETEYTGSTEWQCTYDPTMNEDWYDDVLCRYGTQTERPRLREWDDFVEEWEMRESAAEYQDLLNSGG